MGAQNLVCAGIFALMYDFLFLMEKLCEVDDGKFDHL